MGTTLKERALADFMITFRNTSVVTLIAKILYPFMGFAKPLPKEEVDTLVQKWKTEIWPSVTKMIGYSGGPFVGGSVPNIGELACFGYLNGLLLAKEDHPIFTSDLKEYILGIRNHFTCYEKLWSGELFKKFYAPKRKELRLDLQDHYTVLLLGFLDDVSWCMSSVHTKRKKVYDELYREHI